MSTRVPAVRAWLAFAVCLCACATSAPRSASVERAAEIRLWPGAVPGTDGAAVAERVVERSSDPARPDRAVSGISTPTLTAFWPDAPNGTALVIAPGGGYVRLALDKEGTEVARWFAARGVTAFVLKYRLPSEGHAALPDVPLADAQRAVRLVRARAASFGVDRARIGFLGFSAGGHLASRLGAEFGRATYAPVDAADAESARPDRLILLYPVISLEPGVTHPGSREALLGPNPSAASIAEYSSDRRVSAESPPTLLLLAGDDRAVPPENAERYRQALERADVPHEIHVFPEGGHGFGLRAPAGLAVSSWPELALRFLTARGVPTR